MGVGSLLKEDSVEIILDRKHKQNISIIDLNKGKDVSRFCWAVDDEAGLVAMYENDGEHILLNEGRTDCDTFTAEGDYEIVERK